MIMGLTKRKTSGNIIGGTRMVVPGQDVYNVKKFQTTFEKNETSVKQSSSQSGNNQNSNK